MKTATGLSNGVHNGGSHLERNGVHNDVTSDIRNGTTAFPSITDIKKVLPKHCFQSSLPLSLSYILKDIVIIISLYCSILLAKTQPWLAVFWTPCYWFLQGTMFWALFVLGHDCGHGSFSKYSFLNDVIGNSLHTLILVPYFPWKLSHKHHHKNTGNMDKDEIFYPIREKDRNSDIKVYPLFGFGFSWFMYVFRGYPPRPSNHVNPMDPMFRSHFIWCTVSILSIVVWFGFLLKYLELMGLWCLVSHYLIPVFIFASWLVVVTFLHHNDVGVPWYSNNVWGNVKGQLSSVDRDYGWAHSLTHNIGTHQIHHLFIKIPHYHLEEATACFKAAFPQLSHACSEPILSCFVRMFKVFVSQRHVSNDASMHIYVDENGKDN